MKLTVFLMLVFTTLATSAMHGYVALHDNDVNPAMNKIMAAYDMSPKVPDNNLIVIAPGKVLQQMQISGMVIDGVTGEPLPGVNVVIEGTTTGVITDLNGNYSITLSNDNVQLRFSFIGYQSEVHNIKGLTVLNLKLVPFIEQLEEVVAIGYGSQRKANLTGSVSIASSERLENRPIASAGLGLQGVIPNLNITFSDGDPKNNARYNIRGFESINGGSPLILVDGIPMSLDRINPSDIASVNVLKDASAAAVYGARAAFGVILVETRKPVKDQIDVRFDYETSLTRPIFPFDPVTDPYTIVKGMNDSYKLSSNGTRTRYDTDYEEGTLRFSQNPTHENAWGVVGGNLRFYGEHDLVNKVIAEVAPQHKYNMRVSGGSENSSYYASFGYLNKYGYFSDKDINMQYQRYNVLLKADLRVNDWLSLDPKIVINSDTNNEPHTGYGGESNLNSLIRMQGPSPLYFPDLPHYLSPGDRDQYEQYIGMYMNSGRLYPFIKSGGRDIFNRHDAWLTQGVTLTPAEGLMIKGDFSYQYLNNMEQWGHTQVPMVTANLANMQVVYGSSAVDWVRNRNSYNQYYVFNTYGEYTFNKIENHYIKGMIGFNQEWGRNSYIMAQGENLITPNIVDTGATIGTQSMDGGKSHVSLRGAFYRFNYIYKDKYLLEANGRYDGTSRFPKADRMAFFPSFSAGWRISNETFMDGTSTWLSNLMLRASYGTLGNQLLDNNYYAYIQSMGIGLRPYILDDSRIPYVSPAGLVSSELTWETVVTQNIGLDLALLKGRMVMSADAYMRDTKDMLMRKTYPSILGASAPDANAADLRTKGWEVSLDWRDNIGTNSSYRINLALADNTTEVTKYENPTGDLSDYYVGMKIGEIWGYETVGIFQTDEDISAAPNQMQLGSVWIPGDIQYADLNDDGVISRGANNLEDHGDLRIIGNSSARYTFGINTDFKYKNLSLNLFFQGLFRDLYPSVSNHTAFWPWFTDSMENWWLTETWSEDNRDAYWPGIRNFRVTDARRNFHSQTRYLQNASYIRLKNVTLSYSLPKELITRMNWLSGGQLYISGMNLWESTGIKGPIDPEQINTVAQIYYRQRIFTLGANITF